MGASSIKIENLLFKKKCRSHVRFKRLAKKLRNRIIRRSKEPKVAVKQYKGWEY